MYIKRQWPYLSRDIKLCTPTLHHHYITFSSPLRHHDLTITSPSGREFLGSANVSMRAGIDEKLRWLFKIYDIDSNGQVSKLEITQMCTVSVARTLSGWYQGNHSVAMETRCRPPQTIKSSTRGNLARFPHVLFFACL